MTNPELVQLFPTPVCIFKYEDNFDDELKWIDRLQYTTNDGSGVQQSLNTFVLDDMNLIKIRSFIDSSIDFFVNNIFCFKNKFTITQSWVNKSSKGRYHHPHIHPNSIISGVFYFRINDLPPIEFKSSHKSPYAFEVEEGKFNNFNSVTYLLPLNDGELIIFPSYLEHSVPKNPKDDERISLSFNTFVKDSLGNPQTLTYLPFNRCV